MTTNDETSSAVHALQFADSAHVGQDDGRWPARTSLGSGRDFPDATLRWTSVDARIISHADILRQAGSGVNANAGFRIDNKQAKDGGSRRSRPTRSTTGRSYGG